MALIFDIQVKVLDFNDGLRDFVVRWTKKYAVIDIDDEDDVVTARWYDEDNISVVVFIVEEEEDDAGGGGSTFPNR